MDDSVGPQDFGPFTSQIAYISVMQWYRQIKQYRNMQYLNNKMLLVSILLAEGSTAPADLKTSGSGRLQEKH